MYVQNMPKCHNPETSFAVESALRLLCLQVSSSHLVTV